MPTELHGRRFYSVAEVLADLGVSRQTLWRWREAGHVPRGHRFRNGQVFFDDDDIAALREFALRIEPLESEPRQIALFANGFLRASAGAQDGQAAGMGGPPAGLGHNSGRAAVPAKRASGRK